MTSRIVPKKRVRPLFFCINLFAFKINYNTTEHGAKPQYKYNIAEAEWKTANDNVERWYTYDYDGFERILSATSSDGNYSVSNINYDKMGNIMSLNRSGWQNTSNYTNLDVLSYTYDSGNKLLSVTDSGNKVYGFKDRSFTSNDYVYDANGNLIEDKNKGLTSVTYNHFNFPTQINVTNPDHDGNVQYVYDANGVKLKKIALDRGTTNILEYNGNFVYENGSLKSITHPEGYIEQEDDGSFTYVYEHRDIWKNTRITYADNNKDDVITAAEIRREQNYYPFGMTWKGVNSTIRNATNNLKTFQGQELTEDLGLNTHEWRYRISDRSIGRFWQIDPLSEDYTYNATYAFQENKMGIGTELEGLETKEFLSSHDPALQGITKEELRQYNKTTLEVTLKSAPLALAIVSPIPGDEVVVGNFLFQTGVSAVDAASQIVTTGEVDAVSIAMNYVPVIGPLTKEATDALVDVNIGANGISIETGFGSTNGEAKSPTAMVMDFVIGIGGGKVQSNVSKEITNSKVGEILTETVVKGAENIGGEVIKEEIVNEVENNK
ncbi:RHS repeat domain-containing protein [Aquimarina macrocephali]|uniref:RHS repeat domain-containing protein n=1 Tax=Aquimarina macrocephali TaxID=666563 RepID=UPI003F66AC78